MKKLKFLKIISFFYDNVSYSFGLILTDLNDCAYSLTFKSNSLMFIGDKSKR